jgi:hypothetical protein
MDNENPPQLDEEQSSGEIVQGKLTDWENEPTLLDLKQDLQDALPDHQAHVTKVNGWLDNLKITGKAKPPKIKGKSAMQPKLIRKQAEWRYAALSEPFLSTDDIFNTAPVTNGDRKSAIQNELVLNNQFNTKIKKVDFIDELIRTDVDEGTVICRVGWNNEEEEVDEIVPIIEYVPNNVEEAYQQEAILHEMMESTPDDYNQLPPEIIGAHELFLENGIPYIGEIVGEETQKVIKTIANHPTVDICDYNDIIPDPTTKGDKDKLQFVIYRFETSLSELKKSSTNYKNLDNINVESSSPLMEADDSHGSEPTNFTFKDKSRKKLIAYEYWGFYDIHNTGKTVPFVATWIGETIIRMELNPFPDQKLPFIFIQYLPVRKSIYGEPDGELLEDNQKIVGAVTRGMIDILGRSANGQTGMRMDALDVTNKRKYDNGQDYQFNPSVDPKSAIINHVYPEIPQSAQIMLNMQNIDAESLTGVKSFGQEGLTGKSLGDTVGGQKNALDASSLRKLGILRRLAEGMKQIGHKVIAMNSEFLSDTETVRVTNERFVEVRRDDLTGAQDIKLSISTAEADNEKAQELAFMLQTTGNNMDIEMMKIVLSDIARLRKMPELAKRFEEFQPTPDPLAQKKAELEIALLKAQVFNEQAKGRENAVDVDLKTAKTETEKAKTRNLHSVSDKEDLDFLEKEAGIPHAREMEKADQKRVADLDLKAADKLLNPEPSTQL